MAKPINVVARLRRIEAKLDRAIAFGQPATLPVQNRNVAGQFATAAAFTRSAARRAYVAQPNPQREILKRALLAAIRRK